MDASYNNLKHSPQIPEGFDNPYPVLNSFYDSNYDFQYSSNNIIKKNSLIKEGLFAESSFFIPKNEVYGYFSPSQFSPPLHNPYSGVSFSHQLATANNESTSHLNTNMRMENNFSNENSPKTHLKPLSNDLRHDDITSLKNLTSLERNKYFDTNADNYSKSDKDDGCFYENQQENKKPNKYKGE